MAKRKQENSKAKPATGCRLCKYRVAIPKNPKEVGPEAEKVASCCFQHKLNDSDVDMSKECGLFGYSNYYIHHPEEV